MIFSWVQYLDPWGRCWWFVHSCWGAQQSRNFLWGQEGWFLWGGLCSTGTWYYNLVFALVVKFSIKSFSITLSFFFLIYLISGDYEVSIKFNDEHIPDSPFIVPIASVSDDARLLTVTSLQVSDSRSNPLTHESFFSGAAGRGWFRDSPERMAAPLSTHSLWEHLMESTGQLITRRDKCTCSSLHEEWRKSFSRKTNEHDEVAEHFYVVHCEYA